MLHAMDLTPHVTRLDGNPSGGPRRVCVPGREEVGEVINEGKNLGGGRFNIYGVMVHFPSTGECAYYDKDRLTTVEE